MATYIDSYNNTTREYMLSFLMDRLDSKDAKMDSSIRQPLLSMYNSVLSNSYLNILSYPINLKTYSELSSYTYNDFFQRVEVDTYSLFKELSKLQTSIERQHTVNKDKFNRILLSINSLKQKKVRGETIADILNGYNYILVNKFSIDDNQTNNSIYKAADIDVDITELRLPTLISNNKLYPVTTPPARVTVTEYSTGVTTVEDTVENRLNAIDISDDTYWKQRMVSNIPIVTTASILHDGEYDVYEGTVTSVVMSLFKPSQVNTIIFNPYSEFPLNLLTINIYRSPSIGWEQITPLNYTFPIETSVPIKIDMDSEEIKKIEFVINQKYYSKKTYNIARKDVNNSILYESIADTEYIANSSQNGTYLSSGRYEALPGWNTYINMFNKITTDYKNNINDTDSKTIIKTMLDSLMSYSDTSPEIYGSRLSNGGIKVKNDFVTADVFEYNYGIFNIAALEVYYNDEGVYLSPTEQVDGNIKEVALTVDSELPTDTSIEYDLNIPHLEAIPILPQGTTSVSNEYVSIDSITRQGSLRFTPQSDTSIYRNNELLPSGVYSVDASGTVNINEDYFGLTDSYTAYYTPEDIIRHTNIDVFRLSTPSVDLETRSVSLEEASSLNSDGSFELEHYPYINKGLTNTYTSPSGVFDIGASGLYEPIKVYIGEDEEKATNLTDYEEGETPTLINYDPDTYPRYEYYNDGRVIYTNMQSYDTIKTTYEYVADTLNLEVTLRRTNNDNKANTPVIKEYKLGMKVVQ